MAMMARLVDSPELKLTRDELAEATAGMFNSVNHHATNVGRTAKELEREGLVKVRFVRPDGSFAPNPSAGVKANYYVTRKAVDQLWPSHALQKEFNIDEILAANGIEEAIDG
ncbi:hypothetical protein SAMN02745129_3394 [Ferrimonas marina]|uniref:Uncharacterized protein n=2 Tax=Ferrimonas marina TaxID=299255 RepID=A0A1M5XAQ0_9GAMM|nr:hypothetical protein SAMN02745129_3394 [Ferrimonas marina]